MLTQGWCRGDLVNVTHGQFDWHTDVVVVAFWMAFNLDDHVAVFAVFVVEDFFGGQDWTAWNVLFIAQCGEFAFVVLGCEVADHLPQGVLVLAALFQGGETWVGDQSFVADEACNDRPVCFLDDEVAVVVGVAFEVWFALDAVTQLATTGVVTCTWGGGQAQGILAVRPCRPSDGRGHGT